MHSKQASKQARSLLATALLAGQLVGLATPAFADEGEEVGIENAAVVDNTGSADLTLDIIQGETPADGVVIATVPLILPIIMDLQGEIYTAEDAKVINQTPGKDIRVKDITATADQWSLTDYATSDFGLVDTDTKQVTMAFQTDAMAAGGGFSLTYDKWVVPADGGEVQLDMTAKLPRQTQVTATDETIAQVSFTLQAIEDIALTGKNTALWLDEGNVDENGEQVGNIVIPDHIIGDGTNGTVAGQAYTVAAIASGALAGKTGVTGITVPDSVKAIAPDAFEGCNGLTTLTVQQATDAIFGSPPGGLRRQR